MRNMYLTTLAALALIPAAVIAGTGLPVALAATDSRQAQPLLATADQIETEKLLRDLLADPEIKAEQAKVRAKLAATATGQTRDGAARIDAVVAQWTNSLIFKEALANRSTPVILWGTDDTPRTWFGYTIGGVGTSGDNPDHIYRSAVVDGNGLYEIVGRFDPARRPAQFVLSASRAQAALRPKGHQPGQASLTKNQADLNGQLALLTDKDIHIASDGSFRVTLGGAAPAGSANHIALADGPIAIGFRDVLSDWDQRPAALTITRLDSTTKAKLDKADVRRRVIANLDGYIDFWSNYPVIWFGGLKPNSIAAPVPRDGGWGFLSGLRFQLQPDEAVLVTTTSGNARYTGIQVVDPWMIASSAKQHQTSLSISQAKPNADGSFSYIISPRDPGVANWLDSAGLHDGFAVLRWQQIPEGTKGDALVRDFRIIKLADAAKLPGIAIIDSEQRRLQLATRAHGYENRTR